MRMTRVPGWMAVLAAVLWSQAATGASSRPVPGLQGAVRIPMRIEADSQTTLALYNREGQLVRILGQVLPLKAGDYEVAWDGMDLWGNLVPAETPLTLRVITNPGVRAVYEMAVGSSGHPAWLTGATGEGDARRQGGNLGDHTGPNTVCAVGDRLFFGSALVEYGHNVIATTLAGEKMWGTQIEGWQGPGAMATDGKTLFVVTRGRRNMYAIDPATFKVTRLFDTGADEVVTFAARDNQLTLILKNHAAALDPLRRSKLAIDFGKSQPVVGEGSVPDFQLSPQQRFTTVFTGSLGHTQTGIAPVMLGPGAAYIMAVFREPIDVGSLLVSRIDGVDRAEFLALAPGVAFDANRHLPRQEQANAMDLGGAAGGDWTLLGSTDFQRHVEVVPAPKAGLKSSALFIRLAVNPSTKKLGELRMCRAQALRLARVEAAVKVILPEDAIVTPAKDQISKPAGLALGWDFRTPTPISDLNPAVVTLDLGAEVTLRGLSLLNAVNPKVEVFALAQGAGLEGAAAESWRSVAKHSAPQPKQMGWSSSHINANDRQIDFGQNVTTRALRLVFTTGILAGRGPWKVSDDPARAACADVMLLRLLDPLPEVPTHLAQVRDLGGKVLASSEHTRLPLRRIQFDVAGDGSLYGITDKALVKIDVAGGWNMTTVKDGLSDPIAMSVLGGQFAVIERENKAIRLFDASGRVAATIGNRGGYQRGLYDPSVLGRPTDVARSPDGTVWMVEEAYHPKRIAQFAGDGRHLQDQWGPPEYGGGGYLDPNLQSFYYRGMEFGIDFAKGTWNLRAFNDRYGSQETPTSDEGSFSYTHVGRPIVLNGRKYAVGDPGGGAIISLLENNAWRPAVVMGMAQGNRFLVGRDQWRAHWLAQNLKGKGFIWCDHNGDGLYQVEEVELFEPRVKRFLGGAYWGSRMGRDLTLFTGSLRLAPSRFTDRGVPIYESNRIQPVDHAQLSSVYMGNLIVGGLAKRDYGGASMVAADGSLVLEGQPYRIGPDLKLVGGEPLSPKRTDYSPRIQGLVMDNPLGFVGSAVTDSPLGEVAIMNGNNGPWFLWSVKHGVVVGRIFTGAKGGWTSVPHVRGTDVTEHKQEWETFFGNFLRADDGRYYVVSGKGSHAISRIEGLNDYRVTEVPVLNSAEALAVNTKLRSLLREQAQSAGAAKAAGREMAVAPLARRTQGFKLDGELEDWGGVAGMAAIDAPAPGQENPAAPTTPMVHVAAASDAQGLYLAYSGVAVLKNSAEDPKFLFKNGFCLDFAFRADAKARGADLAAGDKRLLVGPMRGKWIAVLMDYVNPSVFEEGWIEYVSPVLTTRVAKVMELPEDAVKIAVRSGYDLNRQVPAGLKDFTAEVYVTWKALGLSAIPGTLRADMGVLSADAGGTLVERRWSWSQPNATAVTDVAVEAAIQPATFGVLRFEP